MRHRLLLTTNESKFTLVTTLIPLLICTTLFQVCTFPSTNGGNMTDAGNINNMSMAQPNSTFTPLTNEDNGSEFTTFKDDDIGFSFTYPANWIVDNNNSQYHTIVRLDSPDMVANVNVRVFPQGDYKSLKDYGDREFKQDNSITLLEYYRNNTTLLSNKLAVKAIYLTTYTPSLIDQVQGYKSSTSKAMMIATLVPEKKSIFAVAYFADSSNFDKYIPSIESMIKSFKIEDKGPIIQEEN